MPRFQPIANAVALVGALFLSVGMVRAGDILRGGSPLNTARRTATSGANAGAEAAATAAALYDFTGRRQYLQWYSRCWQWIDAQVIDRDGGSWWHELDPDHQPASSIWRGKPDAYHAVQATIIPRRPLGVSVAGSLTRTPLSAT